MRENFHLLSLNMKKQSHLLHRLQYNEVSQIEVTLPSFKIQITPMMALESHHNQYLKGYYYICDAIIT